MRKFFVPLVAISALVGACDFLGAKDFELRLCADIKSEAEITALEKAWGNLKRPAAMIAFGLNKGILTSDIEKLIRSGGKWPEEAWARVDACFEPKRA